MTGELDEIFLRYLYSKRKDLGPRGCRFSWLDITSAERKRLYEIGEKAGLLAHYEFSGIKATGTSRNNAARTLLDKTRERAFAKLKTEFGAKAHFWVEPEHLWFLHIDFYWRRAKLGLVITGPLADDLYRVGRERIRDNRLQRRLGAGLPPNFNGPTAVLTIPYYEVWHQPSKFLLTVRQELVASGCYPKLAGHSDSK